ncbi:MAG: phenylalanine--tRNA ligase beta subunit-related protein [Planctomycetota bacterium]
MEVKLIQISESLDGIARIGVLFLKQITNTQISDQLHAQMGELSEELRRSIGERKPSELDSVERVRRLYRAIGADPTKDRPSSEKLLRRVLAEKPLPTVNTLVDSVNFASLRNQCPMGVYDWDKVSPPVLVRIGQPGEGFRGISSPADDPSHSFNVHGRFTLVDGEGPFGNPTHDSERTRVTEGTVRAMVVAWAPADAPRSYLEAVLRETAELSEEFTDSRVASSGLL